MAGEGARVCAYERTCNFYRTGIMLLFHLRALGHIFLPVHIDLPYPSQWLLGAPESRWTIIYLAGPLLLWWFVPAK